MQTRLTCLSDIKCDKVYPVSDDGDSNWVIYRPQLPEGRVCFGDVLVSGPSRWSKPDGLVLTGARPAVNLRGAAFKRPKTFRLVKMLDDKACVWEPIPSSDSYQALGCVVSTSMIQEPWTEFQNVS